MPSSVIDARAALLLLLVGSACRTTPSAMLELMDAQSESEVNDAVSTTARVLGRGPFESRMAAAKTLGRLKRPKPEAINALSGVLANPSQDARLRAYCAWALGEMRARASLEVLTKALRQPMNENTSYYVLEALAKHYALIQRDQDSLVNLAEALVFYSGNQKGKIPTIYDVLNARTRTVEVNVRVLERSLKRVQSDRGPKSLAALYNAAFELLANLELNKEEIKASAASWRDRVREAMGQSEKARAAQDLRTNRLILWYLGRLGVIPEIGLPAAEALVGSGGRSKTRPTLAPDSSQRMLAAWALARMLLHGPGPRRALLTDVLLQEKEPAILDMVGRISSRAEDYDQLQKTLGVGAEGR